MRGNTGFTNYKILRNELAVGPHERFVFCIEPNEAQLRTIALWPLDDHVIFERVATETDLTNQSNTRNY